MVNKRILSILWMLPILWMGLIFFFSHQPSVESAELSSQVTDVIEEIVNRINIDTSGVEIHTFVRKVAHFTLFFVLGFLLFLPLYASGHNIIKAAVFALLIGCLYAVFDESHQIFIPGRSFQVTDILIDSLGVLSSVALSSVICYTSPLLYSPD